MPQQCKLRGAVREESPRRVYRRNNCISKISSRAWLWRMMGDSSLGRSPGPSCTLRAYSASCQWLQALQETKLNQRHAHLCSSGLLPWWLCSLSRGGHRGPPGQLLPAPPSVTSLPGSHWFPSLGFWASYQFFALGFCSATFLSRSSYLDLGTP